MTGLADRYLSLDLTAASTVHLLEPQWNPSLEDQALARVHRLGQIRPVTTIRYVMEDSFEEVIDPPQTWSGSQELLLIRLGNIN
jgi:hypothetical protein